MKKIATIIQTLFVSLSMNYSVSGQGFVNLGFESANVPSLPPGQFGGLVDSVSAVPNWAVFYGANQSSQVLHNNYNVGSVNASLFGPNFTSFPILQGSYSILLQSGLGNPFVPTPASIAQTGVVPMSATSLRFIAKSLGQNTTTPLVVTLGGQPITFYALSATANYTAYGADVALHAGQNKELRFSAVPTADSNFNDFIIDGIEFSNQPIPEPSVLGLFGLGALLFGFRARQVRKP